MELLIHEDGAVATLPLTNTSAIVIMPNEYGTKVRYQYYWGDSVSEICQADIEYVIDPNYVGPASCDDDAMFPCFYSEEDSERENPYFLHHFVRIYTTKR